MAPQNDRTVRSQRWSRWLLLVVMIVLPGTAAGQSVPREARAPIKRVAVVRDGPAPFLDEVLSAVQADLRAAGHDIELVTDASLDAGWEAGRLPECFTLAFEGKDADAVLALGVLATRIAFDPSLALPKPVVGGFIDDGELFGVRYDEFGRSPKPGLSFVVSRGRLGRELQAFHGLTGSDLIRVALDEEILRMVPTIEDQIAGLTPDGTRLEVVPYRGPAASWADRLPADAPLYLPALAGLGAEERQALLGMLAERGVAVFSGLGRPDVEAGAFAALGPDVFSRFVERLTETLRKVLEGQDAAKLPAYLPLEDALVLSGTTASTLDYQPDSKIWIDAEVLEAEALMRGDPLDLESAMRIALQSNADLAIGRNEVDLSLHQHHRSWSLVYPQVNGSAGWQRVDNGVRDVPPSNATTGRLTLNQVLYDDRVVTGVRTSGRAFEASQSDYNSLRLDVIQAAGQAYLDYLRVLALSQIDIANLRLTASNLRLAEERQKVGYAGREEVYRWASEEARRRAVVLSSQAGLQQARVALNQVLGLDQARRWRARAVELPEGSHGFLDPIWGRVFEDRALDEALARFVADRAIEASPSLGSVERSIEAQALEAGRVKRSFFLPSIQSSFAWENDLDPDEGSGAISLVEDDSWAATVTASIPLFKGKDRVYELREARSNVALATNTKVRLAQLVEQRARTALHALRGSYPAIELIRSAALSSMRNYEIVRDNYAAGRASIIDLLDAQSQAFSLKQEAVITVYDYLGDLLELQRSISFFEALESAQSRRELEIRLETLASRKQGD